jgi:copper(I)-binding protein
MLPHRFAQLIVSASLLLVSITAAAHTSGGIVVNDAWVREAPPVAKVLAAYLTIENHTDKDKVLTAVSSSSFDKIEIHKSMQKGGMATMEQQKQLTVPAQGKVALEPGSFHLMLFTPAKTLKAGDKVDFTLKFQNGSTMTITAPVKKATGGHHHDHGHDAHSSEGNGHDMHKDMEDTHHNH